MSSELAVRASSRRRKDSAAAAPAPVRTVARDDTGFEAPDLVVERVPVADIGVDSERDVSPGAAEVRRWIEPPRSDDEESTPICRSATERATNPTNGDRTEPPGRVVARSTVAVGCRRGPVRADTARRTLCRRRTGDVSGCGEAEEGNDRRAVMFEAAEIGVDVARVPLARVVVARPGAAWVAVFRDVVVRADAI